MKTVRHILNVHIALFLCLQLVNVCVYIPSWMYPGGGKADLKDSVLELVLDWVHEGPQIIYGQNAETSHYPPLNEEVILEDLHPPEEQQIDFGLTAFAAVEHNYYHFTPDLKTHVLNVVCPPPDFC